MPVSDWSTDPNANTSVGGVFIGEGCPPSALNNGERMIMAEAKAKFNTLDAALGGATATSLAAIAALTPAADKVPYFTGPTTAALATLTPFARTLLAGADAAAVATLIGGVRLSSFTPGVAGVLALLLGGSNLTLQWGTYSGVFGEGAQYVPFNAAFPTSCWGAMPWPIIPFESITNNYGTQQIGAPTTNGFSVMVQQFNAPSNSLSGIGWLAIGN